MGFWHTGYMEFHEPTGMSEAGPAEPAEATGVSVPRLWSGVLIRARPARAPVRRPLDQAADARFPWTGVRAHAAHGHERERRSGLAYLGRRVHQLNGRQTSTAEAARVPRRARSSASRPSPFSTGRWSGPSSSTSASPRRRTSRLVDQALDKLISSRELSRNAIDAFIMRAGRGATARRYREGLANYLYGVLAREAVDDPGRIDASGAPALRAALQQRRRSAFGAFDRPAAEADLRSCGTSLQPVRPGGAQDEQSPRFRRCRPVPLDDCRRRRS